MNTWSERDKDLIEFALRRTLASAYAKANEAAQKTTAHMYQTDAVEKLLNDAKDIESILFRLREPK